MAGYARRGDLEVALKLFDEMPAKDLVSWNVMISVYAKQGQMEKARKLFNLLPERDVVSWNAVIAGYVLCGSYAGAVRRNAAGLVNLRMSSHAGMLHEGHRYFNLMREMYVIEASIKHYRCMVDMLGRAGLLKEAFEFIRA
ncbi:pentatricopeptide repeat-containing protein At5g15300-like [Aristolochia californica]|uniref:pentatricopeptide repeat-containing protein At5g15300-like n=1 Tax=Aristolochia californica TaxID=171875 RepID=UPI0035D5CFFA